MKDKNLSVNNMHVKSLHVCPEHWEKMRGLSDRTGIKLYRLLYDAIEKYLATKKVK